MTSTPPLKRPSSPPRSDAPSSAKIHLCLRQLRGEHAGKTFHLPESGEFLVGRTRGALSFASDRSLDDPHALLTRDEHGRLTLRAFPTRTGVYRRLRGEALIEPGAFFSVGGHHLRFLGQLPNASGLDTRQTLTKRPIFAVEELFRGAIPGRRVVRPAPRLIVGHGGCDLDFPDDPLVQARHCELSFEAKGTFLRDLGSEDGTFLRLPVGEPIELEEGDCLRLGDQILVIEDA